MDLWSKIWAGVFSSSRRVVESYVPPLETFGSTMSPNIDMTKFDECDEEFDATVRQAHFAFRRVDLKGPSHLNVYLESNKDPAAIQHWALVVHFPRGNKTFIFEAWNEDGTLVGGYGLVPDWNPAIFRRAEHFATMDTSPAVLVECGKSVDCLNKPYVAFGLPHSHNCQKFFQEFLMAISPALYGIWFKHHYH